MNVREVMAILARVAEENPLAEVLVGDPYNPGQVLSFELRYDESDPPDYEDLSDDEQRRWEAGDWEWRPEVVGVYLSFEKASKPR